MKTFPEAKRRGDAAEADFLRILIQQGYTDIQKSTYDQDQREHWDYKVDDQYIDVKCAKRMFGLPQDKYTFVETRNCGRTGWLYAPKMTHLAFQQLDGSFIVIRRKVLMQIAEPFIEKSLNRKSTDMQKCIDGTHAYGRIEKDERVIVIPTTLIRENGTIYKLNAN